MTESARKTSKEGEKIASELQAQRVPQGLATASSQAATVREVTNTADPDAEEVKDTVLKPGKAEGAQLQPAVMTPSGALQHNFVATGSGPMPAGIVARDSDEAEAMGKLTAAEARRRLASGHQEITAEKLLSMTAAEIRAVAHDRGYDIGDGGHRISAMKFLRAQEEDEGLSDDDSKVRAAAVKDVEAADEMRASASATGAPATAGGIVTGVPASSQPLSGGTAAGSPKK